jgi:hypothetical protein
MVYIPIKLYLSELQLALIFDTVSFDFGHSFYEIVRCSLAAYLEARYLLQKTFHNRSLSKFMTLSKE